MAALAETRRPPSARQWDGDLGARFSHFSARSRQPLDSGEAPVCRVRRPLCSRARPRRVSESPGRSYRAKLGHRRANRRVKLKPLPGRRGTRKRATQLCRARASVFPLFSVSRSPSCLHALGNLAVQLLLPQQSVCLKCAFLKCVFFTRVNSVL